MKAMTCPQCGALIKKISLKDEFAVCDYCTAKILLETNKDKIVEIPDEKKLSPWDQYRENYRQLNQRTNRINEPYMNPQEPDMGSWVGAVVIFLVIGFIVVGIFVSIIASVTSRPSQKTTEKTQQTRPVYSPPKSNPTATPLPKINYQVRVQWDGANDMEYFENPVIESEKLPTFDENELKKTVFKNRGVQVKVTIDTSGEVSSAEGLSGHPILKEAAVNAAKKTLFNPRQKSASRILTYYFRLVTD